MIDPKKYGTASEVAEAVGKPRTTLISAANRGEIETTKTHGGTMLISVPDARNWSKSKTCSITKELVSNNAD